MLKQVFLARFEPVVTRFVPWRMPKYLEKQLFWHPKWMKNGSKRAFPKVILGHWWCVDKGNEPILSPF